MRNEELAADEIVHEELDDRCWRTVKEVIRDARVAQHERDWVKEDGSCDKVTRSGVMEHPCHGRRAWWWIWLG